MEKKVINTGLRGVTIASTKISDVDGAAGKLVYRGYLAKDLAGKVSFEETAYLLLNEELPDEAELAAFRKRLAEERTIPNALVAFL
ncbi:MAG: citrate (Si)-synthase, partial [Deltaproteobacteria bacterium]|nr:citrate (Si)-synthase [Deltaproteobacteria bacterium]